MDTVKWPQDEEGMTAVEQIKPAQERRVRPQKDQALNCPRCNSTNTKFCYYNNYSLTQPRYFCKTCRRYWTEGGSLRNVPVGGGSRKNKRAVTAASAVTAIATSSSSAPLTSASARIPDLNPTNLSLFSNEAHELSLKFGATPNYLNLSHFVGTSLAMTSSTGDMTSQGLGLGSFPAIAAEPHSVVYPSGFLFQDFRPALSFPGDGHAGVFSGAPESGGRLLFPFGEMSKQVSTGGEMEQSKGQGSSGGWWNGMVGSGGSW